MKVVLAYSGGLDTSVILHWIKKTYDAEVIAYTGNVGQIDEDMDEVREAAIATGASEAVVEDLREAFVTECVFPALSANAVYEWYYLMGTALARPVIARGLVQTAERFGADAIAHGATGKGNDQVRFELSAYALKPDIRVIAPWREWDMKGRTDLMAYANRARHPDSRGAETLLLDGRQPDARLLRGRRARGSLVEPPEGMFRMTTDPESAPDEPEIVTIRFQKGKPTAINGDEPRSGDAARDSSTRSAAATASGASTSSRTGSSA